MTFFLFFLVVKGLWTWDLEGLCLADDLISSTSFGSSGLARLLLIAYLLELLYSLSEELKTASFSPDVYLPDLACITSI